MVFDFEYIMNLMFITGEEYWAFRGAYLLQFIRINIPTIFQQGIKGALCWISHLS